MPQESSVASLTWDWEQTSAGCLKYEMKGEEKEEESQIISSNKKDSVTEKAQWTFQLPNIALDLDKNNHSLGLHFLCAEMS